MKTPDPKEELLQQLATIVLPDVFAAAALAGMNANPAYVEIHQAEKADSAYIQADSMLDRSHTPALIEQLSKLKS